ncbi:MAG: PhoH family protein [Candidatus Ratteibacteria bacterium]|nr:PhoH family protein [Candidatus Ratteibacteria bacterium]
MMKKKILEIKNEQEAVMLMGQQDEFLRLLEANFSIKIIFRGEKLEMSGRDCDKVTDFLQHLLIDIRRRHHLNRDEIVEAIRNLKQKKGIKPGEEIIEVSSKRRFIRPRTPGQRTYIEAIHQHDIVFSIGPAGTGKTYLAMAMAVNSLIRGEVSRIILVRPAVEAGEKLGFLPGDIYEKVSPYLRPLYDALYDMLEVEKVKKHMDRGIIEVAPLAFMRGRTLNDSFIILDEAQNSTSEQMKMFLTRLGFDSKTVITGDITQVDLPSDKNSGLIEVSELLKNIQGIRFIYFSEKDVVRHPLIQQIIRAYSKKGNENIGKEES